MEEKKEINGSGVVAFLVITILFFLVCIGTSEKQKIEDEYIRQAPNPDLYKYLTDEDKEEYKRKVAGTDENYSGKSTSQDDKEWYRQLDEAIMNDDLEKQRDLMKEITHKRLKDLYE